MAKKAWWLTDSGEPVIRRYSTATQDDDDDQDAALTFGLGCNGTVHVLLERHSAVSYTHLDVYKRQNYDSRFGSRMRGEGQFAELLAQRFRLARRKLGLDKRERVVLDCSQFCPPGMQLSLL